MATELGLKGVSAMRKPQLIEAPVCRVARAQRRGPAFALVVALRASEAPQVSTAAALFRSQPWKSVLDRRWPSAKELSLFSAKLQNRRPLP